MAQARAIVGETKQGLERIRRILRDLKSFARFQDSVQVEGDPSEPTAKCDVNLAVRTCLSLVGNDLRHRAHVQTSLLSRRLAHVADVRLGQVLVNLVTNAVQAFGQRDKGQNQLVIRTQDVQAGDAHGVIIEVQDNGPGIDDALLPRVFDPFFTTKGPGEGTGMGLTISQEIVQSMGGSLNVRKRAEGGLSFRIYLQASETATLEGTASLDTASSNLGTAKRRERDPGHRRARFWPWMTKPCC